MASGLDGFYYEVTADGKAKQYHFWDPEDATNVADTSVEDTDKDGKTIDSRESAEIAYSRVSKELVKSRDARLNKTRAEQVAQQQANEAQTRAAQADFLANSEEQAVAPAGTEKRADGTQQVVYNVPPDAPTASTTDDKKSK